MKKTYIILTLFLTALFVTSCETYDDFEADRPTVAGFTLGTTLQLPVSANNPTITFNVPFYVSTASDADRTLNVVVLADQTTLTPASYSYESSVVLPAGERSGTMEFIAMNVGLTNEYQPVTFAFETVAGIVSGPTADIELRTTD